MELSCGGRGGGWMRIANIDNGNNCSTGWKQITSPVRACRANSDAAGCYSAYFNDQHKLPFQHVCGKVVGYQKGTSDAFYAFNYNTYPTKAINGPYVDGISLTYGNPRKHLFTYACGFSSDSANSNANCPCATHPGRNPPNFVQDDYYCESGSTTRPSHGKVFNANPLWDGKGCSAGNNCCSQPGMPWFYRDVLTKTSEPIEARICRDQGYFDEGVFIKDLELYVQ